MFNEYLILNSLFVDALSCWYDWLCSKTCIMHTCIDNLYIDCSLCLLVGNRNIFCTFSIYLYHLLWIINNKNKFQFHPINPSQLCIAYLILIVLMFVLYLSCVLIVLNIIYIFFFMTSWIKWIVLNVI